MNETILICKELEYAGKFTLAYHRGDLVKAKRLALARLLICRLQSRQAHAKVMDKQAEVRALERSMKLAEKEGVSIPLAELRVRKLKDERDAAEKELASVGEQTHNVLQLWQRCGAAFEDLCNLCNRDPAQVRREIDDDDLPLCDMAMVYNLDHKNPKDAGWTEDTVDAPLTHALRAYLLDTMLHTEEGRKASHEALLAVFPEIMDHVVYPVTDEDGVQHFLDKDGVEIFTSDE